MPAASALHPQLAFSRLGADAPGDEMIQFYDSLIPLLKAGPHSLSVTHQVTGPETHSYALPARTVLVQGPQFALPPGTVQSQFPPDGGTGVYDQELPFIVLDDPTLPWERALVPGDDLLGTPWLALMLFGEDEIQLPAGATTPVTTCTVQDLLNSDPALLRPAFPDGWIQSDQLATRVQTVMVPGATFNALAPSQAEIALLAHNRGVNVTSEHPVVVSCVLSNRLARAVGKPVKFYAHLVSLEGFADYLPGGSGTIPVQQGKTDLKSVQLVSLANWTFSSLPEPAISFEALVQGLIDEQGISSGFNLPFAADGAAGERLAQGYVPLDSVTEAGPRTFAWYRGPLTPVVPQPLTEIGAPAAPVAEAQTSDALMIYLAQQGLFDLSYAAAWQTGRALALAEPSVAQAIWKMRLQARSTVAAVAQRASHPAFQALADPVAAAAATTGHRQFVSALAATMGPALVASTAPARRGQAPAPAAPPVRLAAAARAATVKPNLAAVAGHPAVAAALAEKTTEPADLLSAWLAEGRLLKRVPFAQLVADPRLLPPESIRFFYVDPAWLDALQAGALSLAIHGAADLALQPLVSGQLGAAAATPAAGLLLRSQLVSGWPTLAITGSVGGNSLTPLRDEVVGPGVRLLLFDQVPDMVGLAEPYQGLRFGIEDEGLALRSLAGDAIGAQTGQPFPDTPTEAAFLAAYQRAGPCAGVLQVAKLAADLGAKLSATIGAGNLALELVKAPELQTFPSTPKPAGEGR